MQVRIMAITDIKTVLISQRMAAGAVGPAAPKMRKSGAERLSNSLTKLFRVHSLGKNTGVTELMSCPVLKAPVTIQ